MLDYRTIFTTMAAHKGLILAEAVKNATVASGGGKPSLEMLKAAALDYAKQIAKSWLLPGVVETLATGVKAFEAARGPRPNTDVNEPGNVSWRDDFDTYLMQCLGEDTCAGMGQDFLGEFFTDNELDNPDLLNRASQIGTERLVDAAVKGRSAGQVIAEIGIVAEDLEPLALPQMALQVGQVAVVPSVDIDPTEARVRVERIIGSWAIKVGVGALEPGKLAADVKLCFDDDPFLPLGQIERFGGTKDDVPFFIAYMKASKTYVDDTVAAAFTAALTGQLVEPATKPKGRGGRKKKETAAGATAVAPPPPVPANAAAGVSGEDGAHIIKAFRGLVGNDERLAQLVGVSRPQISAIVNKGKSIFLTNEHKAAIKAEAAARIAALQNALARLP